MSLETLANALQAQAEARSLDSSTLEGFRGQLGTAVGRSAQGRKIEPDDVEWFQLYTAVQKKLDQARSAKEFGLPDGRWQDLGIQFEKLEQFYDDLKRVGAVRDVSWYLGGVADVRATDLRPIREHLCRQVLLRLRGMGFAAVPTSAPASSAPAQAPIRTKGPGPFRRLVIWLGSQIVAAILGVLLTIAIGYLLLKTGVALP